MKLALLACLGAAAAFAQTGPVIVNASLRPYAGCLHQRDGEKSGKR